MDLERKPIEETIDYLQSKAGCEFTEEDAREISETLDELANSLRRVYRVDTDTCCKGILDREERPGLCVGLAKLPENAIMDETIVAEMFDRSIATVKRAVGRGELPPSIRMFGKPCWTAGGILNHINERLEVARRKAGKEADRIARLGR